MRKPGLLYVLGAAMAVAAIPHALLGWGQMRAGLEKAQASAELIGALCAGWLFGSAAMVALGAVVLSAARRISKGLGFDAVALYCIALAYLVFGLGAFSLRHGNPHFLGFALLGALLAYAAWRESRTG
jgi:hypothetical protein